MRVYGVLAVVLGAVLTAPMHSQDPEASGARPGDLATVEHTDRDWYTNLLWLGGRKCLLLAHTGTLFSVFVPDFHKADLVPIGPPVVAFIHKELEAESLPLDRFGVLDSGSITLASTESRTVLGYMNEMHGSVTTRLPSPAAWPNAMPRSSIASSGGNCTFPGGLLGTSSQSSWPRDHRHKTPPSAAASSSGCRLTPPSPHEFTCPSPVGMRGPRPSARGREHFWALETPEPRLPRSLRAKLTSSDLGRLDGHSIPLFARSQRVR
jgi:hypothetical protein